jgi:hypothetical protein
MSGTRTFVSYARDDQDFVLQLATGLKARGLSLWVDQWDIPDAVDWNQAIDRGLHDCSHLVIVLSPSSIGSQQVRGELQVALDEGKKVVPVLYRACAIPRVLRLVQHIDATGCAPDDPVVLSRIVRALGKSDELGGESSGNVVAPGRSSRRMPRLLFLLILALGLAGGAWYFGTRFEPVSPPAPPASSPVKHWGKLQVSVNVDQARVFIDGVPVGNARRTKPLLLTGLSSGGHLIRVEADGYERQEQRININEGEWSNAGFKLNPRFSP